MSQKNQNFPLRIGYNSGCNIEYTWLLKVKYLLNGIMDLYNYLMSLSSKFRWDPCFRWGDIQLLATLYIWYLYLIYSQFSTKNIDFLGHLQSDFFFILSVQCQFQTTWNWRAFLTTQLPNYTRFFNIMLKLEGYWLLTAQQPKLPNYTLFLNSEIELEGNHSYSNYQTSPDFRT